MSSFLTDTNKLPFNGKSIFADNWDLANAFPKFSKQFDMLYNDITNGKLDETGDWYKAIKAVKDANPLEE